MNKEGFNLITLILSIAIVGILATITFVVLNPSQRLADLNNIKRQASIKSIEDAISRYAFINRTLPSEFAALTDRQAYVIVPDNITYNTGVSCNSTLGYLATTTLSSLVNYLPDVPIDPAITDTTTYGSGYYLASVDNKPKVSSCVQDYDLNNGLIALWKFDESNWSGAVDEVIDWSGTGNAGQAINSITNTSANYKMGSKALTNDGSSKYVSIPYDDSLNLTDAFTIATWVYRNEDSSRRVIIGRNYQWQLYLNYSSIALYLRRDAGDGTGDGFVQLSSNIGLLADQWDHIAATFEPGIVKFYLNGVLVDTRTDTGCADYDNCVPAIPLRSITTGSAQISVYWNESSYPLDGEVDELAIWNRVLSDDEIALIYNLQANSFLSP